MAKSNLIHCQQNLTNYQKLRVNKNVAQLMKYAFGILEDIVQKKTLWGKEKMHFLHFP